MIYIDQLILSEYLQWARHVDGKCKENHTEFYYAKLLKMTAWKTENTYSRDVCVSGIRSEY
jgi:hypothetical protein